MARRLASSVAQRCAVASASFEPASCALLPHRGLVRAAAHSRRLGTATAACSKASLTEPDAEVVNTVWPRARQPWTGGGPRATDLAYLDDSQLWLVTADLQATLEFYVHVLGWKLRCRYGVDWAEVYGPGNITLGFHAREDAASIPKVGISFTTGTNNHVRATQHLRDNGVEVSDPIPAGPAFRRTFRDPNGYECSMIAFPDEDEDAIEMGHNGYGNVQMRVPDLGVAHSFYADKLAFAVLSREPGWLQLSAPGGLMLGFGEDRTPAGQRRAPSGWRLGVSTSSLASHRDALEKAGVTTLQDGLEEFGPVKLLRLTDPAGAPLVAVGKV